MEGVEGTPGSQILLSNSSEDTTDTNTLLSWKNKNKLLLPLHPSYSQQCPKHNN